MDVSFISATDAQEISLPFAAVGLTQGFGYYIQSDLKDINEKVKTTLPFEVQTVDNFPVRAYWGGYFLIPLGLKGVIGLNYGVSLNGFTTGAKGLFRHLYV